MTTLKSYSLQTPKGNKATVYKVKQVGQNAAGMTGLGTTVSAYAMVNGARVECPASDLCSTYAAVLAAGY